LGAQVRLVGDGFSLVLALTLRVNHDRVVLDQCRPGSTTLRGLKAVLLEDLSVILVPIRVELVEVVLCNSKDNLVTCYLGYVKI
jgi:hypothetical protein